MKPMARAGIATLAVGMVGGFGWYFLHHRPQVKPQPLVAESSVKAMQEVASAPKAFITKNESSKDVQVQNLVTRARLTEAYEAAKKKDFTAARAEFIEASYKHKGTDAMNPDYGTLPDQAAYQAIVCLDASGKKDEAKKEYRKFMTGRKLSPLITACFRRLERLNGKNLPEDEALLQAGIAEQEKRIRFETSVCGPKCLEKMLPSLGQPARDYKELSKLCGTTDKGTTLLGLKKGCESLGLKPVGLELNASDFNSLKKPFIWLQNDHFLAVLEKKDGQMLIFDPRYNSEEWTALPKEDNANFRAQGLAFEIPTTTFVTDQKPGKKS